MITVGSQEPFGPDRIAIHGQNLTDPAVYTATLDAFNAFLDNVLFKVRFLRFYYDFIHKYSTFCSMRSCM